MKSTLKMIIQISLFVFGLSQIFAYNTSNNEFYYPQDDNGELMFRNMLTKLNTILTENQQIKQNLVELNKRLDAKENCTNYSKDSTDPNTLKQISGEWTVIQRRQDGSVNFNLNWLEYKKGFGSPNGEFFIGLDKLHAMTSNGTTQELWIVLKDFENETRYAIYDNFVVGSEADMYSLKELGSYRGTASDFLKYHIGQRFSTKDNGNCAVRFEGGWWFKNGPLEHCYSSNLNGPYLNGINPTGGTAWGGFHGWNYSLKFVEMLIRSVP